MDENKKVIFIELIGIVILSFIFGVGLGNIFVGNLNLLDEGQFASWGFQMLQGKKMFSELFIMYGPLYVYPLYVFFKVFGVSFFAIRFIYFIESLIGIVAVYLICINLDFKRLTRLLIVLFLVLLPAMQIRQAAALITVLLLYVSIEKKNKLWSFAAGLASVATFLISPEVGIFLTIAVLVYYISFLESIVRGGKLKSYLLGVLAAILFFIFWAGSQGWFNFYIRDSLEVLKNFSGINSPLGKNFPNILILVPRQSNLFSFLKFIFSPEALLYWGILFLIIGFIHFAARFILRKLTLLDKKIMPIYVLSLFSYLTVVGRASVNNIYFVLPFALIVGGYLVEIVITDFKPWNKNITHKIIPTIVIAIILMIPIRLLTINRENLIGNLTILFKYENFVPISKKDILRISPSQKKYFDSVLNYVDARTTRDDTVFILQDEPGLYVIVNRLNATRFDLPYFANSENLRLEVLYEIKQKRPKIIVWSPKAWSVDEISNWQRLPEVVSYINKNYRSVKVDGIIYYILK